MSLAYCWFFFKITGTTSYFTVSTESRGNIEQKKSRFLKPENPVYSPLAHQRSAVRMKAGRISLLLGTPVITNTK